MHTKHFPLNLQSGSTLSKLRNFRGGGFNPPKPLPRYATGIQHPPTRDTRSHVAGSRSTLDRNIPYQMLKGTQLYTQSKMTYH